MRRRLTNFTVPQKRMPMFGMSFCVANRKHSQKWTRWNLMPSVHVRKHHLSPDLGWPWLTFNSRQPLHTMSSLLRVDSEKTSNNSRSLLYFCYSLALYPYLHINVTVSFCRFNILNLHDKVVYFIMRVVLWMCEEKISWTYLTGSRVLITNRTMLLIYCNNQETLIIYYILLV